MGKYIPKLPFGTVELRTVVDYDSSLSRIFKDSGLKKSAYEEIDLNAMPFAGKGQVKRLVYLVPFFKPRFTTEEATGLLAKLGLQLGKAEDLLAVFRDRKSVLELRDVGELVEFGTIWIRKVISEFNCNLQITKDGDNKYRLAVGHVSDPWGNPKMYLLAVAEDDVRRKIHKTPRVDCPYPQPKPYTPRAGSGVKLASVGIDGALTVRVAVDYAKTAKQMADAAGYKNTNSSKQDIGDLSVTAGKPVNSSQAKFVRDIFLVPVSKLSGTWVFYPKKAGELLAQYNLEPAHLEDLLAVIRDYPRIMQERGIKFLVALGSIHTVKQLFAQDKPCYPWVSPENPVCLNFDDAGSEWQGACWTLATLKPKSK